MVDLYVHPLDPVSFSQPNILHPLFIYILTILCSDRYYEFFKATHFFFAMVFVIFFFLHCDFRMSSWDYFIATAVLYSFSWLYAQCRTYFEHGIRHKARLVAESNETLKVTIDTRMEWGPGQHIFLRFLTGMHGFTAHPFTICSVPQRDGKNQLVFYIKQHGGVTGRLMSMARKNPDVQIPVLMDGPYGGISAGKMEGFDKSVVIGGGAGAGLTLSTVEDFVRSSSYLAEVDADRELQVIVATRDPGMRAWYLQALEDLALRQSVQKPVSGLSIHIHETFSSASVSRDEKSVEVVDGEVSATKIQSVQSNECASTSLPVELFGVQFFTGRPDLPAAIHKMASHEGKSVAVIVCGPSSMTHDVSMASSDVQSKILGKKAGARELWLHRENFS